MDVLKKLKEPVLWFFAALFFVWGWQLCGTAYIAGSVFGILIFSIYVLIEGMEQREELKTEYWSYIFLLIGSSIVFSAVIGSLWASLVVLAIFLVFTVLFDDAGAVFGGILFGGIAFAIGLGLVSLVCPCPYWEDKEEYDAWFADFSEAQIPSQMKNEVQRNPFLYLDGNILKPDIKRIDSLSQEISNATEKMIAEMRKVRAKEVNADLAQFDKEPEIVIAKRIWLTSDVLPWTYSMWKSVSYKLSFNGSNVGRRTGGVFSGSGTITPDMAGNAKYVGDNELSYINILFSDNSYKRFSIKDNPEWLLVREGERIRVEYKVNYVKENQISLEGLVNPIGSFSKTYVPLYK